MSGHIELAHEFMSSRDWRGAADALRTALDLGQTEAAIDLGYVLRQMGDIEGARDAYEAGELAGDPRCTYTLGALLEDLGELNAAIAAYKRADAVDFAAGAFALGQMAYRSDDFEDALHWCRRGDALGDADCAYNLGYILAHHGNEAEAEAAYERADERGSGAAAAVLGKRLQDRKEHERAEDAYARAEQRGDADGAYGLGSLYYDLGRTDDATYAFRRAVRMGHKGAADVLTLLGAPLPEQGGYNGHIGVTGRNADELVRQWVNTLTSLDSQAAAEARRQKASRDGAARHAERVVASAAARAAAFSVPSLAESLRGRLSMLGILRPDGLSVDLPRLPSTLALLEDAWAEVSARASNALLAASRAELDWRSMSRFKRRNVPRPTVDPLVWVHLEHLQALQSLAKPLRERETTTAQTLADEAIRQSEALSRLCEELVAREASSAEQHLADAVSGLAPPAKDWVDTAWAGWQAESPAPHIRLGEFKTHAQASGGDVVAPVLMAFPPSSGLAIQAEVSQRERANGLARSSLFRMFAAVPAGLLRMTFVDPVAIGQSVADFQHLGDYDARLIDTKPWVQEHDIGARIEALAAHAETVIAKYLRGQYATIDEYNMSAGEVSEPYRLLVIFDYPSGFTEKSSRQLLSLIENGPRCGVHTILTYSGQPDAMLGALPPSRLISGMQKVNWIGESAVFTLSSPLDKTPITGTADHAPPLEFDASGGALTSFADLLNRYGAAARSVGNGPVTMERLVAVLNKLALHGRSDLARDLAPQYVPLDLQDASTWWHASSAGTVVAPLGRLGAGDLASLRFSSTEIAGGGIMVGLPRSGKTTALHSIITLMCLLYGPDELELFLIDAKHGVEFHAYERLPHARMISIHSEREFSLAILKSLDAEIGRRAKLMKDSGTSQVNITGYREATGLPLPRIVLIMDEFHELFEEDDRIGQQAFSAFSNIVRQGPFAGVHVVVSSQTLTSMPALDRSTLTLLPERVAFMCNETDADLVMGDTNQAVRHLSKPGEGIFNPLRGVPAENRPFQGALTGSAQRERLVSDMAALAEQRGWKRRPRIFDGDALVQRPNDLPPPTSLAPRLALGEPYDLRTSVGPHLRRQRGSNLLIIGGGDPEESADPSATSALMWTLLELGNINGDVSVVDFGAEELLEDIEDLQDLAQLAGASYTRARGFEGIVHALAEDVRGRHASSDYKLPVRILCMAGVHRAPVQIDLAHRSFEEDDDALSTDIAEILQNGPDVGVHVVATAPTLAGLEHFMPSYALAEFGHRVVAGSVPPSDMYALSPTGDPISSPRPRQSALLEMASGRHTRFRAWAPPSRTDFP